MKKIFGILLLTLMLAGVLTSCSDDVLVPEIKSGEFNFSVTYEYKGNISTVSGVYVCEYAGKDWVLDGGWHREWKGYIKDSDSDGFIHLGTGEDGGKIDLDLCLDPDYFMGDFYWSPSAPLLSVSVTDDEGFYFITEQDEIAEIYGARIISYEYDEPIVNTFS